MKRTVKIRVAVAVGEDGAWAASGSNMDGDHMGEAVEFVPDGDGTTFARYWLTATVELPPAPKKIVAIVKPAGTEVVGDF